MKKEKTLQILLIIGMCCLPLLLLCSCGLSDTIMCTWCGDKTDRVICYASGTTDDGIKYNSCVGLSGCLGIGCDSSCFPVECLYVDVPEKSSPSYEHTEGCVYYYEDGCVDGEHVKSTGTYQEYVSCLNCFSRTYVENNYDGDIQAFEQVSCLNVACRDFTLTTPKHYNEFMPRQFPKGCWSCSGNVD